MDSEYLVFFHLSIFLQWQTSLTLTTVLLIMAVVVT